jgi:hypothetical protein
MKKNIINNLIAIASIVCNDSDIFGRINDIDVVYIGVRYVENVSSAYINIISSSACYYAEAENAIDAVEAALEKIRKEGSFDIDAVTDWSVELKNYFKKKMYCGYIRSANGELVDAVHVHFNSTEDRLYAAHIDIVESDATYVATHITPAEALLEAFEEAVDNGFFDFSTIVCWD